MAPAERLRFIDVAKGMSIVLVAFGHSHLLAIDARAADVNRTLALFRMPFFFFLSGIFFDAAQPFGTLLRQKSESLLKPYVVTLGVVAVARTLVEGAAFPAEIAHMAYGVGTTIDMPWAPLWYLPHAWLVFLCAWLLVRMAVSVRLPRWTSVALLAASPLVGLACLHRFHDLPIALAGMRGPLDGLPFGADMLAFTTPFFLLGFALREHVVRFRPNGVLAMACLLIFAAVNAAVRPHVDLNQRIADHPLATVLCSLAGIYLALAAAHALNATGKLGARIAFLGFNGIFILIFHAFFEAECRRLMSAATSWRAGLGISAVAYVASVVLAAGLGTVIRRTAWLALLYVPRKHRERAEDGDRPRSRRAA